MFWNKKEEIKYERSTKSERKALLTKEIDLYRQIVEELENGYLPVRDKCEEAIRSHGLNRYPLSMVMQQEQVGDEYIIKIYDLKEDWWDGNRYLKKDTILLEERFRFEAAQKLDHESLMYGYIYQCIGELRRDDFTYIKNYIILLGRK